MSFIKTLRTILQKTRYSGLVQVTLLLSLGIAILFWQVLLLGYVQVPGDIPLSMDPVMREAMPQLSRPQNPILADHISPFYVWHTLAARSMQTEGKIPLWNPYMLAGQPLVANAQPALFYPPNLLFFWFDPGLVASIRSMFNLFIAGLFTYLLARELNISKLGATLSAIAFSFSGALIVVLGYGISNSIVWLPFTLWASEKMLKGSRVYFWALVISIGISLSILGGHPHTSFHNLLAITLYVVARLLPLKAPRQSKLKLISLFVLAIGLGAMLSAVQWLPFVSWWLNSATFSRSPAWNAESAFYSSEWLHRLPLLVTLAFPSFFGNPVDGTYLWPFNTFQNYFEQTMYIGLLPLALAVGAVFIPKKRKYLALGVLTLLAIVMLAVSLRLPGFELVNHLPVLDRVNNTRLKWYFSFFAAILAGMGLDHLIAVLRNKRTDKGIIYPVIAVLVGYLGILLSILVGKYLVSSLIEIGEDSFAYHLLFNIFSFGQIRTTITIFVLAIGIGILIYGIRNRWLAILPYLFIALTFIELVVLAYGYNTTLPREKVLPGVRLTETLGQDPEVFRILTMPPTFWPNYGAVYGLYHVGGYDLPIFKRYAEVYEAQGGKGGSGSTRQAWSPEWPLIDWMNIKYVISPMEYELEKLELVYEDSYRVYRNKDVLPRAYMVHDVQVIESEEKMLEVLTSGTFDFRQTVLLGNELPANQKTVIRLPSDKTRNEPESVQFLLFTNDRVELSVEAETPGMLVMSDVFTPGWKAMVDGQPVPIQRANYTFRAVFVPAGAHRVAFYYQPLDFQIGRAISLLALLVLVIGLPVSWTTGRKEAI